MCSHRYPYCVSFSLTIVLVWIFLVVRTAGHEVKDITPQFREGETDDSIGPEVLAPKITGPTQEGGRIDMTPSEHAWPVVSSAPTYEMDSPSISPEDGNDGEREAWPSSDFSYSPEEPWNSEMAHPSDVPHPSVSKPSSPWSPESMPSTGMYPSSKISTTPKGEPPVWPSDSPFPDYEASMMASQTPEESPLATEFFSPSYSAMMTTFPIMSVSMSAIISPSASMSPSMYPSMSMTPIESPSPSQASFTASPSFSSNISSPPMRGKCRDRFLGKTDMRCVANSATIRQDNVVRYRFEIQQEYRALRTSLSVWGNREFREYAIHIEVGKWGPEKTTREDFGNSIVSVSRQKPGGKPIKVSMISQVFDVDEVDVPAGTVSCCNMRVRISAYMMICMSQVQTECREVILNRVRKIRCWNACFVKPYGRVLKMSKTMRCSVCQTAS